MSATSRNARFLFVSLSYRHKSLSASWYLCQKFKPNGQAKNKLTALRSKWMWWGEVALESDSFVFSFPDYDEKKSLILKLQEVQCDNSVLPSLVKFCLRRVGGCFCVM